MMPTPSAPSAPPSLQQTEAARYAVLRRLSPSLRHHMVRHLQPIGLICGLIDRKLARGETDIAALRASAEKINECSKAAQAQCVDIGTWLAPEPVAQVALDAGVTECVGLLATTLHFRGFRLANEVDGIACPVRLGALRMVLIAALLESTDALTEPATLTLSAAGDAHTVTLRLQFTPRDDGRVEDYDDGYRKLTWSDVQALAADESVSLSRQDALVTMTFAIEAAPAAGAVVG